MADELSELVDQPVERLDVEYKRWVDLDIPKTRADLARHIAAIANHGGGSIVFGIEDHGESCGPAPDRFQLTHDIVAGLTRKYLEPPVHCDVRWVVSASGVNHPVILVPPHGPTPICAKANGPENKGKIEGIVAGTYYLRKPGPESSAIVSPADWLAVIRRCVMQDRAGLLAGISAALAGSSPNTASPDESNLLEAWAAAADAEYQRRIHGKQFAAPIDCARFQLSYRIHCSSDEALPHYRFDELVRQLGYEVDQHVQSGWSLFHVFSVEPLAPRWAVDPQSPAEDFLQASYLDHDRTLGFDLWRIAPSGFATTIREYWEDTPDYGHPQVSSLNPRTLTRTLGELVRHAEAFSSRFSAPERIEFRCEWRGLQGRQLWTPNAIPFNSRPSETDAVVTKGTWPVADLGARVPEAVVALAGRVARALDWDGLTVERVAAEEAGWRVL